MTPQPWREYLQVAGQAVAGGGNDPTEALLVGTHAFDVPVPGNPQLHVW
jgi:hypothetical protein